MTDARPRYGVGTVNTPGPGDFLSEIALLDASPEIRVAIMEAVGARPRALEGVAAI